MRNTRYLLTALLAAWILCAGCARDKRATPVAPSVWEPITSVQPAGILGERLELWRQQRLWRVGNDPFLLEGFESPPGKHAWQGEHVGKWLHAATLTYQASKDPKLLAALQQTVERLLKAQAENGYLGTYVPDKRFYSPPGEHTKGSWDVWTHRYVLYGLLTYERFHPDARVVEACSRIGDLLIDTFGPERQDLTSIGTRHGLSSATLLESVMMLYARTGEERFLDFAKHLHQTMENNEQLRVVSHLSAGGDAEVPGDGKAYQLMAVLLGYGELYRFTGDKLYLETMVKGWENIRSKHTFETGGPWSYKADEIKNKECFAREEFFDPTNPVENCSTVTWVQQSLELLRLTGEARYAAEAERVALNHLFGAQSPNGIDWAYFTPANCPRRAYNDVINCCASSGPRALEMYARHLLGRNGPALAINTYLPLSAKLDEPMDGVVGVEIKGNYPFDSRTTVSLEMTGEAAFPVDFLLPEGTDSLTIIVGGETQEATKTAQGYWRVERTWRPGEEIEIDLDFRIDTHYHDGRDGHRWVAFTRGPLALAQEVEQGADEESSPLVLPSEETGGASWLEPLPGAAAGRGAAYKIRETSITLVPYFLAGGTTNGVRTYFPVARQ